MMALTQIAIGMLLIDSAQSRTGWERWTRVAVALAIAIGVTIRSVGEMMGIPS